MARAARMAAGHGASVAIVANKTKEISRLQSVYDNLLHNSGVHVVNGRGTIVDAHKVKVADKTYTA